MEIRDIIRLLDAERCKKCITLNNRKKNINSDYQIAKLDFVVIDNLLDSTETLRKVIDELELLQERIIKRNGGK